MKPAPFDLVRPLTLADAVVALGDALSAGREAKVIAGGQSLVPLLAMRLAAPTYLVDLNAVAGIEGIASDGVDAVRVGAMTRHRSLAGANDEPLLAAAARWIGHTAIRTRGTIGGSLAHADPNAEWPAVALACDGGLTAVGRGGTRTMAAGSFFEGLLQTGLADDEILTAARLERPRQWGFAELARRHGDFALVLSVVTRLATGWRVVLGGVAGTPLRCPEAEAALDAGERDPAAVAAAVVGSDASAAFTDLHASAAYRRAMAGQLTAQALTNLDLSNPDPADLDRPDPDLPDPDLPHPDREDT